MAINVYFGLWETKPEYIKVLSEEIRRTPIPLMKNKVYEIKESFWTNNPYWITVFPSGRIYLCLKDGVTKLALHPEWFRASSYFTAGEFANNLLHRECISPPEKVR